MSMQRNHNIDILRFILCAFVVFLHVDTPYRTYTTPITRCAVPCFFIISGFMLYSSDMRPRLVRSIKKITVILIWSTLVFALVNIPLELKNGNKDFLTWKSLLDFFLFNENPFGFHLWYLSAYIYALAIILALERCGRIKLLFLAIPVLLAADLAFGTYSRVVFGRVFNYLYVRNFLCVGLPYLAIGMLLKKFMENADKGGGGDSTYLADRRSYFVRVFFLC